jgi:hypothetical protein
VISLSKSILEKWDMGYEKTHHAQSMSEKMPKAWKKERRIAHVQNKEGKWERCVHENRSFNNLDGNNLHPLQA